MDSEKLNSRFVHSSSMVNFPPRDYRRMFPFRNYDGIHALASEDLSPSLTRPYCCIPRSLSMKIARCRAVYTPCCCQDGASLSFIHQQTPCWEKLRHDVSNVVGRCWVGSASALLTLLAFSWLFLYISLRHIESGRN